MDTRRQRRETMAYHDAESLFVDQLTGKAEAGHMPGQNYGWTGNWNCTPAPTMTRDFYFFSGYLTGNHSCFINQFSNSSNMRIQNQISCIHFGSIFLLPALEVRRRIFLTTSSTGKKKFSGRREQFKKAGMIINLWFWPWGQSDVVHLYPHT